MFPSAAVLIVLDLRLPDAMPIWASHLRRMGPGCLAAGGGSHGWVILVFAPAPMWQDPLPFSSSAAFAS